MSNNFRSRSHVPPPSLASEASSLAPSLKSCQLAIAARHLKLLGKPLLKAVPSVSSVKANWTITLASSNVRSYISASPLLRTFFYHSSENLVVYQVDETLICVLVITHLVDNVFWNAKEEMNFFLTKAYLLFSSWWMFGSNGMIYWHCISDCSPLTILCCFPWVKHQIYST